MNMSFFRCAVALAALWLVGGSASAQVKIATLDLKKVYEGYWKTKQATVQLNDNRLKAKKELEDMVKDFNTRKGEHEQLLLGASEPAVSTEERERRKKQAEDKFKQMRDLEDTIRLYDKNMTANLTEQGTRLRGRIFDDIKAMVKAKAQAAGFTMVVDSGALGATGDPIYLYVTNDNDLTDSILLQLNATAPASDAGLDDKPAVATPEKKKETKR